MTCGGADDGANSCEQVGPPLRSEAAGDPAVGGGRPQFAFAAVVVGADLGMVEEGEEVTADLAVSLSQALAISVGGCERHHRVEFAFHPLAVLVACAFGQMMSPPGHHERAQQQRLHARGEDGVARLNGELAVA